MDELLNRFLGDPFITSVLLGLAAAVVGLWLASCWWVFRDAARRTASAAGPYFAAAWVFLSGPVLLPFSLGIYSLVRPLEPTADRRSRSLLATLDPAELEQPTCPRCAKVVEDDWRRCPACATWLGVRCDRCERWAPADAQICPWCAWVPGEATDPETLVVRPLVPVLVPAGASVPSASAPLPPAAPRTSVVPEPAAPAAPAIASAWSRFRRGPAPVFAGAAGRPAQTKAPGGRPSREREAVDRPGGPVRA